MNFGDEIYFDSNSRTLFKNRQVGPILILINLHNPFLSSSFPSWFGLDLFSSTC